MKGGPNMD